MSSYSVFELNDHEHVSYYHAIEQTVIIIVYTKCWINLIMWDSKLHKHTIYCGSSEFGLRPH